MRMLLEKKVQSLRNALRGMGIAWREELNFKIEVACGILALLAAALLEVSRTEFIILFLVIGFVLATETLNTALEEFCDMVRSSPDPHVAKIKDLAAAAVLISSIAAIGIGAAIFLPRILAII